MPGARYRTAAALSAGASNFTNGAINRHNGIGGTIRMAVKKGRVAPQKTRTAEEVVGEGWKKKIRRREAMKSVCVCVRGLERAGGREGGKDGGPLFISVPQALLGICVLRFRPKCNLSAGLIQSVRSSSVQTQSLSLTCNPPPHPPPPTHLPTTPHPPTRRHHQRRIGNNETHSSDGRQSHVDETPS